MPLRTTRPIPIRVALDREAREAQVISVPMIKQEQSQWCWASGADMILHYYGNAKVRQCELANWAFGVNSCCRTSSRTRNAINWPQQRNSR